MIALTYSRSVPRYVAARALGRAAPGLLPRLAPLRLSHHDDPAPPGDDWVRVAPRLAGICGSDLAMIDGTASFYFGPITSMPFVPGHEVVGELLEDTGGLTATSRVVIEPVLACAARAIDPPCPDCSRGDIGLCTRTANGHLAPGLQTGFCEDTGGGWGTTLVAHPSQVHPVPDEVSDEAAVLVEPLACAVHAVLRAGLAPGADVLVVGAGTMGLLVVAALRHLTEPGRIIVAAKHPHQRAEASRLGADLLTSPREAERAVRLATGALMHSPERGRPWLAGGVDVSFECVGSAGALDTCLRSTRGRGRVVLVGLGPSAHVDLAPVWHRELEVVGAYTYGLETVGGERRRTFDIALELAARLDLDALVGAVYPLTRHEEAIDHAMDAGRLGTTKVAFAPQVRS